jgi:hypothetical protein
MFFFNGWESVTGCEDKMRVQIVESYFHIELIFIAVCKGIKNKINKGREGGETSQTTKGTS